jgi:hypothetical protein
MAQLEASARRSGVEWSVRAVLALLAVTLGYIGVTQSLANLMKARKPSWAYELAPSDGRMAGSFAKARLLAEPGTSRRARAGQLAQRALRQDPMVVPAVITLGLMAQLDGNILQARRLFRFSDRLTRRDQQAHLWAIQDEVEQGDIPAALRRYDLALRTSRTAPDLLFPVLASASAEPEVMTELVKTLAARPAWGQNFIDYVAGSGPDPLAVSRLLRALLRVGIPVSASARSVAITRLISHNALADAWAFYAASHRGADPRRSRDPRFAGDFTDPTPFDWVLTDEAGLTASVQRSASSGGIMDFAAPGGVGGMVLQQVQMLPPGDYRLDGHSIGIDQRTASVPYWVLTCLDKHEIGRISVPNSNSAHGNFSGRFRVPTGCPLQRLSLMVRPSDSVAGVTGQIDRVQVRPLIG